MSSCEPAQTSGDSLDVEVVIDRERCIGSQNCVHHLPAMFEIDDEGLAVTHPAERGVGGRARHRRA